LEPVAERANAIRPSGILDEIKALLVIKFQHAEDVLSNPRNSVNPDSKPRLKATPKTKTTYR
jgi:hypothetical protein